jgi:hypothetical protein
LTGSAGQNPVRDGCERKPDSSAVHDMKAQIAEGFLALALLDLVWTVSVSAQILRSFLSPSLIEQAFLLHCKKSQLAHNGPSPRCSERTRTEAKRTSQKRNKNRSQADAKSILLISV